MDDIEFYEQQVKFQANLEKIQQKRAVLEQEFFNLTKTDKKLQSLRTTKLRSYWKQVCERERKAQERNEALLADFRDFEERLSKISAHTATLEQIKEKCENELTKLYPQWRYEIDVGRARRQLEDSGIKFNALETPLRKEENFTHYPLIAQVDAPLFKLVPYNFEKDLKPSKIRPAPPHTDTLLSTSPQDKNRFKASHHEPQIQVENHISDPDFHSSPAKSSIKKEEKSEHFVKSDESFSSENFDANLQNRHSSPSRSRGKVAKEPELFVKSNAPLSKNDNAVASTSKMPSSYEAKPMESTTDKPVVPPLELHRIGKLEHSDSEKQLKSSSISTEESDNGFIVDAHPPTFTPPDPHPVKNADVHQVEIEGAKQSTAFRSSNDFLSDLSDVSSVSLISSGKPPAVDLENGLSDEEIRAKAKSPSLKHEDVFSAAGVSHDEVASIKSPQPIKIPTPNVESMPSESLATTKDSQKDVPLTFNPAYQNMLRSTNLSSTFEMSRHYEDDQDDLDKMVSPKSKGLQLFSDAESERESHEGSKSGASSYKSSPAPTPKKMGYEPSTYMNQKQKAPWDTDSEEEDSYKIPKAGQVSSADEDDFDFYD